jgi:myo-inositol catabolism protein IolC
VIVRWRGCDVPIVDGAALREKDHRDHLAELVREHGELRDRVRDLTARLADASVAVARAEAERDSALAAEERAHAAQLATWVGAWN